MNYYEVLGVKPDASHDQIRRAYRGISLKYHPDKNLGNAEAERIFRKAAEAYGVLSDSIKRRRYDRGFDPVESIADLFARHPYGRRVVGVMLPSAPAAAQPGVDMMISIAVSAKLFRQGGAITVQNPNKDGPRELQISVPPGAEATHWCRFVGLGSPGRNHGEPGDLWVCLVLRKKK